jgi:ketosteroid isomerase-like protein
MTDLSTLQEWLVRYERAWRSNDPRQIGELFTEDAVYRWRPWDEGSDVARGRDAIVNAWLEHPDDPSTWSLDCEVLAVTGDLGDARCVTKYGRPGEQPARIYHNVWLVRLTDGRCRSFVEYYMTQPDADTAAS